LLGLTLYEEGNRAAAIERLLRVVRLRPEHAGAQAALGTAYRDLGNYVDARAALERSLELDPKDLKDPHHCRCLLCFLCLFAARFFPKQSVLQLRFRFVIFLYYTCYFPLSIAFFALLNIKC
jgi:tetratricopeptide (TPR) repeat protein